MKKSPVTMLLVLLQAAASIGLCVASGLWLQKSREFNRVNAAIRVMNPLVAQNKAALTQLVSDAVVYSEKNPSMRTLLLQMGVPLNQAAAPAATRPNR
ncbi:MAG TPA: hypothetical protein VMF06_10090 [Candidatus Limnocylindria bacterium]|jgi:hypothetical protein|nr:hypothetical protein [Candidatus Limnocylindria bacterium]